MYRLVIAVFCLMALVAGEEKSANMMQSPMTGMPVTNEQAAAFGGSPLARQVGLPFQGGFNMYPGMQGMYPQTGFYPQYNQGFYPQYNQGFYPQPLYGGMGMGFPGANMGMGYPGMGGFPMMQGGMYGFGAGTGQMKK